jgi:hypothetical protein
MSTKLLMEISTRNLPGGKGRPVRKVNKPTAICEPFRKCGSLTRVEAGSNTSTVTLRVVRGDEMGLKKRPRHSLSG